MRFSIPPAGPCFRELRAALLACLVELGHEVADDGRRILLNPRTQTPLHPNDILFDVEHVRSPWWQEHARTAFPGRIVWTFRRSNLEEGRRRKFPFVHVPLGFHESWLYSAPAAVARPIEVVFLGTQSWRRIKAIESLNAAGVRRCIFGRDVWGDDRAKLLMRAQVGLNLHYYDDPPELEVIRVFQHLAAGLPTVTEPSEGDDYEWMKPALVTATMEMLGASCASLVGDVNRRRALVEAGLELWRTRSQKDALAHAIEVSC